MSSSSKFEYDCRSTLSMHWWMYALPLKNGVTTLTRGSRVLIGSAVMRPRAERAVRRRGEGETRGRPIPCEGAGSNRDGGRGAISEWPADRWSPSVRCYSDRGILHAQRLARTVEPL